MSTTTTTQTATEVNNRIKQIRNEMKWHTISQQGLLRIELANLKAELRNL